EMDMKEPSVTLDHQKEIIDDLSDLFNSEEFYDVQIVVNSRVTIKAHKVILALRCDFFRNMFSNDAWKESKQKVVELTEDDCCVDHFETFLSYFYCGCLTIHSENVFAIYMLSDKYNVVAVKESCEQFALANITTGTVKRAIAWCHYAKHMSFKALEDACNKFIALNMMEIIKSTDWLTIEPDHLSALLQRSDLVVEREFTLFRALIKWLSHNQNHTKEILQHIKYTLMSPEDVYDPSFSETLSEPVKKDFVSNSTLVYQVNSLPIETIGLFHDITSPLFSMRLYTFKDFGCARNIQNYSCMPSTTIEFSTKLFQLRSTWTITLHRNDCYQSKSKPSGLPILSCKVRECNLSDTNHEHQLTVLLYKCVDEKWLACDLKTINVPHFQDVTIQDLIPESKLKTYVHNNTTRLHFIGKTLWMRV
ncbi:BTB/POZ domain-containing protein 17-like, partial [Huso huso]